jgi:predicted tellurium resistance membrane protein TerC
MALVADGIGFHLPRGYIYFAIGFSLFVELLNGASKRARGRAGATGTRDGSPQG